MLNSFESRRLSLSDLKKRGLFELDGTMFLEWESVFTKFNDLEDKFVVSKSLEKDHLQIGYWIDDEFSNPKRCTYYIPLIKTRANFQGFRYYFACPLMPERKPCLKRASVLYKPPGGLYFGCRSCYGIKYPTQVYNQNHSAYSAIKREIIERKISTLEDARKIYAGKKTRKAKMLEKLLKASKKYPSPLWR